MESSAIRPEKNELREQIEAAFSPELMEKSISFFEEFRKLMAYYQCAMMEIETKFNVLNEEFSLQYDRNPISNIKTRLKKPLSIRDKLLRQGLPVTLSTMVEGLQDVAGVRVVCAFQSDVYLLAEALLKQDDITLISRKDYIENPKPNGYRSLHLIVAVPIFLAHEKRMMKVEIQLRTIAMDSWASLEHQLRYKKSVDFNEAMAAELLYCAGLSRELDLRMDSLRNLVQNEAVSAELWAKAPTLP